MKTYAIFYNANGYSPCGDRSIVQIDGRLSRYNKRAIAMAEKDKRGFHSVRLFNVENLRDIPDNQFTHLDGEESWKSISLGHLLIPIL